MISRELSGHADAAGASPRCRALGRSPAWNPSRSIARSTARSSTASAAGQVPAARQTALAASLAEYCRSHELQLSGVFTDATASTDGPPRAAFTGLLDVLALPDVYGVVAPAASHLGPEGHSRRARDDTIERPARRLLLVRRPRPRPTALAAVPFPDSAGRPRSGRRVMRTAMTETTQRFFRPRPNRSARPGILHGCPGRVGPARPAEDVRLCVSELATNALVHGTVCRPRIPGQAERRGRMYALEVHDSRRQLPELRQPADTDLSGRGLHAGEPCSPTTGAFWTAPRSGKSSGPVSKLREGRRHDRHPHPVRS